MGKVVLSDDIQDLLVEAKPQIEVTVMVHFWIFLLICPKLIPLKSLRLFQALLNQEDYYTSTSGKVLVFDEDTKKISQTIINLRSPPQSNWTTSGPCFSGIPIVSIFCKL